MLGSWPVVSVSDVYRSILLRQTLIPLFLPQNLLILNFCKKNLTYSHSSSSKSIPEYLISSEAYSRFPNRNTYSATICWSELWLVILLVFQFKSKVVLLMKPKLLLEQEEKNCSTSNTNTRSQTILTCNL